MRFRSRRRSRALTLLEVVIASVLTLVLVTIMVKWASVVQLLANAGTSRTETSRTATVVAARLGSDVDASIGCDPLRRDRTFSSVAPSEVVLYADDDADSVADRVTWRISGSQITRAVEHGTGSCQFEAAQAPVVVTNLVRPTAPASFSLIQAGTIVPLSARVDCTASSTTCSFDALRLNLTLNGDESAPYAFERSFPVDRRIYSGGVQSGALASAGFTTPAAPDAPIARLVGGGIEVSFAPPASDGGSEITSYQVTILSGTGSAPVGVTGATTRTTSSSPLVFDGLTASTSYSFTVTAVNVIGAGPASARSNSVTFQTMSGTNSPVCTTPGVPASFSLIGGLGEIQVTWSPPSPAPPVGCEVTSYQYSLDSGAWAPFASNTSPETIRSLATGQTYGVRIRAVNSVGGGTPSASQSATTYGTAGAPTITQITGADGVLYVSFNPPNDTGGAAITGYKYSLDNGAWTSFAGTSSPQTVSGLSIQTYSVRIRAVTAAGDGSISASMDGTANGPPAAPTSVSASTLSSSSIRVSWTYSSAPSDFSSFSIFNSAGSLLVSGISSAARSYDVGGLSQTSSYGFYVKGVDTAGNNSSASNTATASTSNAAPPMGGIWWEDGGHEANGSYYHRVCWYTDATQEVYTYTVVLNNADWQTWYPWNYGSGWYDGGVLCSGWFSYTAGSTGYVYVRATDSPPGGYSALSTNSNTRSVVEGWWMPTLYGWVFGGSSSFQTAITINACSDSLYGYRDPYYTNPTTVSWLAHIARAGSPWYDLTSTTRTMDRRHPNGYTDWSPRGVPDQTISFNYTGYGFQWGSGYYGSRAGSSSPCYWNTTYPTKFTNTVNYDTRRWDVTVMGWDSPPAYS